MATAKTILFPTDFSAVSEAAFLEALAMAKPRGAELLITHVVPVPGFIGYGVGDLSEDTQRRIRQGSQEALDALAKRAVQAGVSATTLLLTGTPHEEIASFAADKGAELIVLGTHGRTGVSKFVLGSVAARVMCEAPCPVLTVRCSRKGAGRQTAQTQNVLFATDFSATSDGAFMKAIELAKLQGATLVIAHVIATPGLLGAGVGEVAHETEDRIREGCQRELESLRRQAEEEGIRASTLLVSGTPHQAIGDAAEEKRASLIVLGTHGRTGVSKFVLGSVAARVICEARCPVLTVRDRAA